MEASNGKKAVSSSSLSYNHAVSRSNELLSCAKTAWKIHSLQQQKLSPDPYAPPPPMPTFQLAATATAPISLSILEEGLTLLRAMEFGSKKLQILVRRRGHTNDPTQEISNLVQQLEQDLKELTEFCEQVLKTRRRSQHKKHWEYVVQWFQQVANQYSSQLKECLELRSNVLAEQALKRKKLVETSGGLSKSKTSTSSKVTATPLFDSPLFSAPPPPARKQPQSTLRNNGHAPPAPSSQPVSIQQQRLKTNETAAPAPASNPYARSTILSSSNGASSYYGGDGYGGAGGGYSTRYGGYGGADSGGYGGTGMRQRRANPNSTTMDYTQQEQEEEEEKVHQQIQQRQQQRQTSRRLDEARQAETMLGELGQLFGKMTTLISTQGEQLEKIEDDVEAAHADVAAGQEELTTLYQLKKGNRPLIIKTFLILNFLIVFMRAYKK